MLFVLFNKQLVWGFGDGFILNLKDSYDTDIYKHAHLKGQ